MLTVNPDLAIKLRKIIDSRNYQGAQKDFLIQYSVFIIDKKYYNNRDSTYNIKQVYLACTLPQCFHEGIHSAYVKYDDTTKINVYSTGGNYEDFLLDRCIDYRDKSNHEYIYTVDLYPNFKLRHYSGHCFTKTGCSLWNWYRLDKYDDNNNNSKCMIL